MLGISVQGYPMSITAYVEHLFSFLSVCDLHALTGNGILPYKPSLKGCVNKLITSVNLLW